jgi:DNA invertase Pin-like site-specific DNA recombinase
VQSKVRQEHLERLAVVYIRQSTLVQVLEHRESTERQYDLAESAKRLGWSDSRLLIIDEDLAHSGETAANRSGFQRLVAEVSLGRVGAIFSLEVSRLARSSADWHRLLDLCALSNALIMDDDGVYDPNDFNDRLVLGMKGTMSDAERHVMRLRLQGGKLHKAKKGQLAFPSPTGYVFDAEQRLGFDPDERVQGAVRLLFERFRIAGSAYEVVRYFSRHRLVFPSRHAHKDARAEMIWQPLTYARVLAILGNPMYAGAYAYGRKQRRRVLAEGAVQRRRETALPRERWHALIQNAHPGYITWEQHEANLKRLDDNHPRSAATHRKGAPRNGEVLLQGLALCGRCGRRMQPRYRSNKPSGYECSNRNAGGTFCWYVPARYVDEKFTQVFLDAVTPPELDLSLAVLKEVEHQAGDLDRQWKLRIERARYEAERAERQYNEVEPENRVVARTLETRWNEKLEELGRIEREHDEARRARKLDLTDADRTAVRALAENLPKVWRATTTTQAERKQIVRMLVESVALSPIEVPKPQTRIRILWKTGAVTEALAARAGRNTNDDALDTIRRLAAEHRTDADIATALNRAGIKSGRAKQFTAQSVTMIRSRRKIAGRPRGGHGPLADRDQAGRYSIKALAAKLKVAPHNVRYWGKKGLIEPVQDFAGGPVWFTLTAQVEARLLKAREALVRRRGTPSDASAKYPAVAEATLAKRYRVPLGEVRRWIEDGIVAFKRAASGSRKIIVTPAAEKRIEKALGSRVKSRKRGHALSRST